jgi:hypothetical protein
MPYIVFYFGVIGRTYYFPVKSTSSGCDVQDYSGAVKLEFFLPVELGDKLI